MKSFGNVCLALLCIPLLVPLAACQDITPEAVQDLDSSDDTPAALGAWDAPDVERQLLSDSGRYLRPGRIALQADAQPMAEALDIPAAMITNSQLTYSDLGSAQELTEFGKIIPRRGASMVALSTGYVVGTTAEPGTDVAPMGEAGDQVTLRVELQVPAGANQLSFDYNFLSAESPDYIGSAYNDEFVARVTDAWGTREIARASVNSSFFFDASYTRVGGSGYYLLVDDPSGLDTAFGPTSFPPGIRLFPDAGLTDFQTASIQVAAGGTITLEFDIRDQGDGLLDSMVLLDNVAFTAMQILDPNPDLIDRFSGQVKNDPAQLAVKGNPVYGVAADGATQLLLRVSLPDSGQVTFSIDGNAPTEGSLSAVGAQDHLTSVVVNSVEASPGQHFAFALYESPADFNRGIDNDGDGEDDDAGLARWSLNLSAQYTPASGGGGFAHQQELMIHRPPVVIVHDLWSNCLDWEQKSVAANERFTVNCVDYGDSNAMNFDSNQDKVPKGVFEAIDNKRKMMIATTRVDLIGHGMGGLLARKFVDWNNYIEADNFQKGYINRLITLNTPHLGTRMADEIIVFRDFLQNNFPGDPDGEPLKTWNDINDALTNNDTRPAPVDQGAMEDLRTNSADINAISRTAVPSHAIIGSGGLNISQSFSLSLLPTGAIKFLYSYMQKYHPLTYEKSYIEQRNLIFYNASKIFCTDDHDLFVTAYDQAGGINPAATTTFMLAATNRNSAHWGIRDDARYADRIEELLNTPVSNPAFAEFPSPGSVARVNNCVQPITSASAEVNMLLAPLTTGTLDIVAPVDGTPVTPGSVISVSVQPGGGFAPDIVMIMGTGNDAILETAPFDTSFQIPEEAIGAVELEAVGIDADGTLLVSNRLTLPVTSTAMLQSMRIMGDDATLFGTGTTRRLTVLGEYDDGVTRNISSPAVGSLYSSSNNGIVTVTTDGLITAISPGIATVAVRNGYVETSISVTVKSNSVCYGPLWTACTPECPCEHGVGDCDEDTDCTPGSRCLHDAGAAYGYSDPEVDVCVAGCPAEGAGAWNFCTPECPCSAGQGDCDNDGECAAGLECVRDVGASYGWDPEVDVCEAVSP